MNPQFMAGPPPAFNNNPAPPSSAFAPHALNGASNANQINANFAHKMQNLSLEQQQPPQQNGPFSNGPSGHYQQSPPRQGQLPPGQLPPGQFPPGQMPSAQMPPGQMPARQMPPGQYSPGQLPPSQLPPSQLPPGQLPPRQAPQGLSSGHMTQSQLPPSQFPPRQMTPGLLPSGPTPPSQLPPGQAPANQLPPGLAPTGQPGQLSSSQLPPRQMTPGQQTPGAASGQGLPPVSRPSASPLQAEQNGPPNTQPQFSSVSSAGNMQRPLSNFSSHQSAGQPGQAPSQPQQLPPASQMQQQPLPPPLGANNQQRTQPPLQNRPNYPPQTQTGAPQNTQFQAPQGQFSQGTSNFPGQVGLPNQGMPSAQTQNALQGPHMPPPLGQQYQKPPQTMQQPGIQNQPQGFTNQQPGFPPQVPGLSPQQPGFPPQPSSFPPQQPPFPQQQSNFPPQQPGFPPQQPGFPPQQSGFPPQQPGFPPQQAGFPPQQPGFPAQQPSFPPQQAGFAPQQPGFPPQQPGFGTQQPGYNGPQAGYPGQQGQYGYNQQAPKRLNPDQMPSPIQVMIDDQNNNGGIFVTNQKGQVPPLVATDFTVEDQGNASPRYIRSSMYSVPATADMIKQTAVPFCVVVSPMAELMEGERPPPLLDVAQLTGSPGLGPVRCSRCKAYLCPAMRFIDAGRHFQCAFCKTTTEVPMEYTQYLNTGQQYGQATPEMSLGCYEIVATKEYCRNNVLPQPPALIFVVDVSYNAVRSGLLQLVLGQLKATLSVLPSHQRVGIITYGATVHFYNINEALALPQMLVVGDVQEVFVPLSQGLLVEPSKAEHLLDALAQEIPNMFRDTKDTETILLPAVQAGLEALKAAECCGKLLIFHSSLPTAQAPGRLANRDDRKLLGTDKEKSILSPQTKVYNEVAQECVAAGCGVELFLFNSSYIDAATLGQLPRLTGGSLYKYTYFQADIDGERFLWDLRHVLTRPTAYDAVMRVRTSTGVRATDFYGNFFMSNTTDVELATLDSDKAIGVEIKHDDKLTGEDGVYIQVALLYTHVSGQRRLRICNLALNVATQMADVYRCCDLDAIIDFLTKQAVWRLSEHSPKSIKEGIIARCAQSLVCYRKHCASPTSAGQLVLPESMKLLPLYANCLIRSDALSGGADMSCDDRSWAMQTAMSGDVSACLASLYPSLLCLSPLGVGEAPQPLRCSAEKMRDDSLYLLENGVHMLLWIGLQTPGELLRKVFGVSSAQEVDVESLRVPVLNEPANIALRDLLEALRRQRRRHMRLTLVRQHDKLETVFRHFLVEDQGQDGSASYVDFLCHVHKEIRALL